MNRWVSPRRLLRYLSGSEWYMRVSEKVRDDMKGYTARNIYSHLESDDSGMLDHQSEWIYKPNEAPFMRRRMASVPMVRIFDFRTHSKRSAITRPIVRKLLREKSLGTFSQPPIVSCNYSTSSSHRRQQNALHQRITRLP